MLLPTFAQSHRDIKPLLNTINHCDAFELLARLPDDSIDLIVTSPPYDNLRTYNGYHFDFEKIAHESYRILKPGGVLVWVVGDATINGSETGTSFKQALYFKDVVGFNLHDTMIYAKNSPSFPSSNRYSNVFEYMFILSKGSPSTFNPVMVKSKWAGTKRFGKASDRQKDGRLIHNNLEKVKGIKPLDNIWHLITGYGYHHTDDIAYNHPATFPEKLAHDHIYSWSNEGDIVLDYFIGSGTTAKMAMNLNRHYIGCDISHEYVELARKRLQDSDPFQATELSNGQKQLSLFETIQESA